MQFVPLRRCRSICLMATLALLATSGRSWAQVGRDSIPSTKYFTTFGTFYDGDYHDAVVSYLDEQRGSIKTANSRWIDSICYYTQAGECYYHMGQLPQALAQYTRALEMYCSYSDWMMRVQFPSAIRPSAMVGNMTPWGQSRRGVRIGQIPEEIVMSQGQVNNNSVIATGGVVQQAIMFPVRVSEIVRCTTLAMRRRRELLGPISKHDPLTSRLVTALAARPGPPNHWSEAWIDVQLGAAYASAENWPQAITALERALVIGNEYDHPLTGTALLELGLIAFGMGDYVSAARYFEETTYSAAIFGDLGLLEEAFRYGQMTHVVSSQKGIYPPLITATAWAKTKGYRQLNASLLLLTAENFAVQGDTVRATALLNDARATVARRDMLAGIIGARLNHLTALALYQAGNVSDGDTALNAALTYENFGSMWMFQLGLADQMYLDGEITKRLGLQLYEQLLRDPVPADWSINPLECLAYMNMPHNGPFEHWFEAVMDGGKDNQELAVEIADRARRHRFYSTLPLGGRLLALRWLLEGPVELLSEQSRLERQELLSRYSDYDALAQQARKLHSELAARPPVEEAADAKREQVARLASLATIGKQQETILRQIAVRREPADLVFPPVRATKDVQQALPPGHVLLTFFATEKNLYAFVFGREKYTQWHINSPVLIQKNVTGMLREMGHFEQNHQLSAAELAKEAWRKTGARVMELLSQKQLDLSAKFDELIVVPDGFLWYVPFEALPIDRKGTPLISHVRVRYAPTTGLAVPYTKAEKPQPRVGVVLGKLYPHDDDAVSQAAYEQLAHAVPQTSAWPAQPPASSSVYRSLFDELIVLDDIHPGDRGSFDWSPAQVDRNKPGASLGAWLQLPWGGPERVILPGFHSSAENALKRNSTGSDLFLAVTGLMASGAKTVLISRWRVGGQTSFDLVREFAQELPHTTPADAWQRSVLLVSSRPLDTDSEPRIKRASGDGAANLSAANPFFWSGYMLVDSGKLAPNDDLPPPPVLNFQKKAGPPPAAGKAPAAPNGLPPLPPGPVMQPPAAQIPPPEKK